MPAAAAPGDFDPSFGQGGIATLSSLTYLGDAARDTAGRIVVVGTAAPYGSSGDLGIVRLLGDGTLDPTFSGDGSVRTDLGATEAAVGVAIQTDGRIVVAGTESNPSRTKAKLLVVRYRSGGHLDRSFGVHGVVTVDVIRGTDDGVKDVAFLEGGRIVVVGAFGWQDGMPTPYVVLLGPRGAVKRVLIETSWPDGASYFAVAPWPGGGFVAAGAREPGPDGAGGMLAVRYRADGTREQGFGVDGARTIRIARHGYAFAVLRARGGRMVLAGQVDGVSGPMAAVVRLEASGPRDLTFGGDGLVVLDPFRYHYDQAMSVAVDGRSTVVGVRTSTSDTSLAAVARLTARGTPDGSFGTGGRVEGALGLGSDSWPRALVVEPGLGYVVAGGWTGPAVVSRLLST
jgi:uncharacterized delta-60 repeat protein